jgi:hypothetical protein
VVFFLLEFSNWQDESRWPYNALFGLEEGLLAQGIEPLIIPTAWLPYAQALCANQHFDQVWIEIVHQNVLDIGWLQWLSQLAPVRVGFMGESLTYTPEELAVMPGLTLRRHGIETRLRHMTHVLAVDEKDVDMLNTRGSVRALWWPMSVPERVIAEPGCGDGPAVFPGTPYGKRQDFLAHPRLQRRLVHLDPPESQTIYPSLFEGLQAAMTRFSEGRLSDWQTSHPEYLHWLRRLRRNVFDLWIASLGTGSALVNLPHMVKTYASRVYEGMAAGRPVVSWDVPDRPRNRALFEVGSDILLFQQDSPEELAEHLAHIQADPQFATRIAANATAKIRRFHTAEARVDQILDWIESGAEPVYV